MKTINVKKAGIIIIASIIFIISFTIFLRVQIDASKGMVCSHLCTKLQNNISLRCDEIRNSEEAKEFCRYECGSCSVPTIYGSCSIDCEK